MPSIRSAMLPVYPTPIVNMRWPEHEQLNAALAARIRQAEAAQPGLERSNVGGWHSALDFLDGDDEATATLRSRLRAWVLELNRSVARNPQDPRNAAFHFEGWANVLRHGEYNSLHAHPNAAWAGVYYVNGNAPPSTPHPFSGKLELVDPRPGASLVYSDLTNLYGRCLIDPAAGQMVMFPGWLQHQVHPFFGPGERLSIAFNVLFD